MGADDAMDAVRKGRLGVGVSKQEAPVHSVEGSKGLIKAVLDTVELSSQKL
jgi:hypothetical protein